MYWMGNCLYSKVFFLIKSLCLVLKIYSGDIFKNMLVLSLVQCSLLHSIKTWMLYERWFFFFFLPWHNIKGKIDLRRSADRKNISRKKIKSRKKAWDFKIHVFFSNCHIYFFALTLWNVGWLLAKPFSSTLGQPYKPLWLWSHWLMACFLCGNLQGGHYRKINA